MLEKIYSFGGLDLRSSEINRDKNRASDLQNVRLNSRRELIQRDGYDLHTNLPASSTKDTVEYRKYRELLFFIPQGPRRILSDGSEELVTFGGISPSTQWDEGIDSAEYSNILYFTDLSGGIDLYKYDGHMAYRAGMPTPVVTPTGAVGSFYYRIAIYNIDLQGNVTWSDYYQTPTQYAANMSFDIETLNGTEFHSKYGISNANQTIDAGNLSMSVLNHNYIGGDTIRALDSNNEFVPLKIQGQNTSTITFTAESVGTRTFNYGAAEPIERRTFIMVAKSANATYGYEVDSYIDMNHVTATQSTAATGAAVFQAIPLNDIYDTGVVRQLPPKCKYVEVYGGTTLVLGNYSDTKNLQPDLQKTTPQQESTIFWSSVYSEFGTSVENFLPFYREIVGKSDEGVITGLFGASDSLIILKENQVYYLNGVLQEQAYRPRSALSERVGCVSHRSIIGAEGGCLFMSENGIYLAKYGQKPLEISDIIEPLFTSNTVGLDLTQTRGDIDYKRSEINWFIPATLDKDSVVVAFDYYYKEWFLDRGINAKGGLTVIDGNDLYHSDGNDMFKRSTSTTDNGQAIDAYYATAWHHLGIPSIRKKFTNFVLASLTSINWDCNLKTQEDWNETDRTDVEFDIGGEVKVDDRRINITQCKSLRFIIRNAKKAQKLFVTGYEFEIEGTQQDPKGES